MSNEISVRQSNIHAGRDVVAGDVHNHEHAPSPLARLNEDFIEELKSNKEFEGFIDKLQHWNNEIKSTAVIGVEQKLRNGDREDLIDFGKRAKELFSKQLLRHQYSMAAQSIFAYLLGTVWASFNSMVIPRIKEGVPKLEVDRLINSEIVRPVEEILGINPLGIDPSEIQGMIYFLTGNCHLNWD